MAGRQHALALIVRLSVAASVAAGGAACTKADHTGARLELAAATLVVEQADGTRHVFALAATGEVTFDGERLITLQPNGHIVIDGKPAARVERDGTISARSVRTNAMVHDDGAFLLGGEPELTLGADGVASGPLLTTMDHPRLALEGARVRYQGPPGARRAVMVGFAAFVTGLPAAVADRP